MQALIKRLNESCENFNESLNESLNASLEESFNASLSERANGNA
jgi:hypothetical protein